MLRFGFYDVLCLSFAVVLSLVPQPSEGIIVSYGTRQGPIEPVNVTPRRPVNPIQYRSAPAPVWEVIDDVPDDRNPFQYSLPAPYIKPSRYPLKLSAYYPGKSAVQFGVKYTPNHKNVQGQKKQAHNKFQHKFAKKYAKYTPEKLAAVHPMISEKLQLYNDEYNRNAPSNYI